MKKLAIAGTLMLAMLCTACEGGKTIDASSEETVEKSIKAMTEPLSQSERVEFGTCLQVVVMKGMLDILAEVESADSMKQEEAAAAVQKMLHGKSVKDIQSAAAEIVAELGAKDAAAAATALMAQWMLKAKKLAADTP
jgi:CheY-specific phosphatase CheX